MALHFFVRTLYSAKRGHWSFVIRYLLIRVACAAFGNVLTIERSAIALFNHSGKIKIKGYC